MEQANMDKNCNKRGGLSPKVDEPSSCSVTDLPDVLLQACLSFVGPGYYRFVAGTCHMFQENYNFPQRTTWKNAASSVPCANLCHHDKTTTEASRSRDALKVLTHKAACMGNVKVLQWALDDHSFAVIERGFIGASECGHVNVLEWAQKKRMNWFSRELCEIAAINGQVGVLDWIHRHHPVECSLNVAAEGGHVPILQWMKENGLIDLDTIGDEFDYMWWEAASISHMHLLEWLLDNGLRGSTFAACGAAFGGQIDVLLWAREHGMAWDTDTCASAARGGRLDTLRWLHENGCPWDENNIRDAEISGHWDIAQWARDNGCPEPEMI